MGDSQKHFFFKIEAPIDFSLRDITKGGGGRFDSRYIKQIFIFIIYSDAKKISKPFFHSEMQKLLS